MKNSRQKGTKGEDEAARYFEGQGYSIKGRNIRVGYNELDLIVEKGKTLVFVEVKWRSKAHLEFPEAGLSRKQIRNIIEASDWYVKHINWKGEIRFDLIAIVQNSGRLTLKHFEDAFWPFF